MSSDGSQRLSDNTLGSIGRNIAVPAYDRATTTAGIVHIGVGAFHRAHQAVYVDDCLAAGERDWGIVGASLRSADTREALRPQDGLYTLAVQSSSGEALRVIGSVKAVLVAPEDPEALVSAMAEPATRIVSLTVTEKAYLRDSAGELDRNHADVRWDVANPDRPRTVYGFLAAALRRRLEAGVPAFTVLCCDNLPANGETVRRLFLRFLDASGQASDAMRAVAFPSTMVDRIVPATTNEDRGRISKRLGVEDAWPVKTEPFMQWVVEDDFPLGRPQWERFGVEMADDVRPFEEMKLRLLNGVHSAMAYFGLLTGHETISEAFADPAIRRFVDGQWAEAMPTLPADAGLEPDKYIAALAERFGNTALVHRTAQIAMDGSQKLPQRVLAPAAARLAQGRPATHLLNVVAAWIAACGVRGKSLPADCFTDPLDDRLAAIFAEEAPTDETVAQVFSAAGFFTIDRAGALAEAVARHLETIGSEGAEAAMKAAGAEYSAP